jgi:hypothetical protein
VFARHASAQRGTEARRDLGEQVELVVGEASVANVVV